MKNLAKHLQKEFETAQIKNQFDYNKSWEDVAQHVRVLIWEAKQKTLIISCVYCGEELDELGALLFSPPFKNGETVKFHLCKRCYKKIKKVIKMENHGE